MNRRLSHFFLSLHVCKLFFTAFLFRVLSLCIADFFIEKAVKSMWTILNHSLSRLSPFTMHWWNLRAVVEKYIMYFFTLFSLTVLCRLFGLHGPKKFVNFSILSFVFASHCALVKFQRWIGKGLQFLHILRLLIPNAKLQLFFAVSEDLFINRLNAYFDIRFSRCFRKMSLYYLWGEISRFWFVNFL